MIQRSKRPPSSRASLKILESQFLPLKNSLGTRSIVFVLLPETTLIGRYLPWIPRYVAKIYYQYLGIIPYLGTSRLERACELLPVFPRVWSWRTLFIYGGLANRNPNTAKHEAFNLPEFYSIITTKSTNLSFLTLYTILESQVHPCPPAARVWRISQCRDVGQILGWHLGMTLYLSPHSTMDRRSLNLLNIFVWNAFCLLQHPFDSI
jgi:hypothetical protein